LLQSKPWIKLKCSPTNNNNFENWWRKGQDLQWKWWKLESKVDYNIRAIWNKSDCSFNLKCVLKVSWFWTSTRKSKYYLDHSTINNFYRCFFPIKKVWQPHFWYSKIWTINGKYKRCSHILQCIPSCCLVTEIATNLVEVWGFDSPCIGQ